MSVADLATLQGWPEEAHHALPVGRHAAVRILGQSVPPPMAEWAARLILKASPEDEPLADPRRRRVTVEESGRGMENDPCVVNITLCREICAGGPLNSN